MGGYHFGQPYTLLFHFDIQTVANPLSLACALQFFFLIALLTSLHRDKGPLVYVCIVWESHEPWAYGCIFLSLFFLPSHYCIPSYLIGCVIHLFFSLFYILLFLLHILSTLSGDLPQFITWRMVTSLPLSIPWTLIQRPLV